MTTAPGKKNMGTMAIVGVLSVILLAGTLMFAYFGYQLLVRKPASGQAGGPTPKGTGVAIADPQALTRTSTPARTGVVIVAATAPPPTSEGGSDAPGEQEPTPTPTRRTAQRTAVAPGSSGGSGKLPQTGLGLGTPVFGLLLAGIASAARWMRQRR